jgi:hypothetical protein
VSKAWPVPDVDPKLDLASNARRILAVRIAEYYSWAPAAAREDAGEALHELRIAAKRLRYTLELFRAVFGKSGGEQISRVKAIQEELGELHDHDVRIAMVEDELRVLAGEQAGEVARAMFAAADAERTIVAATALRPPPDDPRRGLLALLAREHDRRADRFRRFQALWDEYAGQGMRSDLVALSATPTELAPRSKRTASSAKRTSNP